MRHFTIVYKKKTGYNTETFLAKNLIEAMWCMREDARIEDVISISSMEATEDQVKEFEAQNKQL